MSGAEGMKELLRPLGVYDLEGPFLAGELATMGAALDGVRGELEDTEREFIPLTAQDWGLEQIAALLPRRPVADTAAELGEAVAALLRIGGDSFTPAAIQDTLRGCGAVCSAGTDWPQPVSMSSASAHRTGASRLNSDAILTRRLSSSSDSKRRCRSRQEAARTRG